MLSGDTHPLKGQGFDKFYTGQTYKTKGKVFPVHVINAYARWPSVVNVIPVCHTNPRKGTRYPPPVGPRLSMELLETKIIVPTRIRTPDHPAGGRDAILIMLHGLPKFHLRTGHEHPTMAA